LLFSVSWHPKLSQKVILVLRKFLELKSYSRKCSHRSHFFLANSDFGANLCYEIF
jgi:hypothetical protein